MEYDESDWLQLAGLQHYAFCPRQWALIHIEQQWAENYHTVDGSIMHERVHDMDERERRGDVIIVRGLPVRSAVLGISGQCDAVEFHADVNGVTLQRYEGHWRPFPVEYKRGRPKQHDADLLQLCAQAMCLEEMLCCEITSGAMYYGETRRRQYVDLSEDLRQTVRKSLLDMHKLYASGYTPKPKRSKACKSCSLCHLCIPVTSTRSAVADYISATLEEE